LEIHSPFAANFSSSTAFNKLALLGGTGLHGDILQPQERHQQLLLLAAQALQKRFKHLLISITA